MKSRIVAILLFAGGSLFAQSSYYGDRHYQRQDLRNDYRDVANDYTQSDRLGADIARDRYRLNQARAYGDRWQARRIERDLARDERARNALRADIARDRRDIRHDRHDLNRDSYWRYR